MAPLKQLQLPSSSPPPPSFSLPILYANLSSIPKFFKLPKPPHIRKLVPLSSSSHTNPIPLSSTSPIFLPFLQENNDPPTQITQNQDEDEDEELEKENIELIIKDPIFRFFKSQVADPGPDPSQQGKITLQKNRKISWHLAFVTSNNAPLEEEENYGKEKKEEKIENSQLGDTISMKIGGVVGEILEKARTLQQNVTLGEVLEGYEERVGEKECVEVLEKMGEERLILCCLYFWEWMRSNEPCLLSPRACSVLFPILGRAGMGKELMVLSTNLPNESRFRDVHIYNAAISGLLCCGSSFVERLGGIVEDYHPKKRKTQSVVKEIH